MSKQTVSSAAREALDRIDIVVRRPSARVPGPRLLGRREELGELLEEIHAARRGRGTLFTVTGDAGIGKTSLLEALQDEAARLDTRFVWGLCEPSQLWEIVRTGDFDKDLVRVQSPTSKLAWDVERASPDPRTAVILHPLHDGANQKFVMKPPPAAVG